MAANEERIQSQRSSRTSRGATTSRQPITSSLLSSALASAGIPTGSSRRSEGLFNKGISKFNLINYSSCSLYIVHCAVLYTPFLKCHDPTPINLWLSQEVIGHVLNEQGTGYKHFFLVQMNIRYRLN